MGGGAQEHEYNYERDRVVHKSIALCNKVHEGGVHVPPVPLSGSATPIDALHRPSSRRLEPQASADKASMSSSLSAEEATSGGGGDENNSTVVNQRGTYKSYTLRQKLEVAAYGREHSEAEGRGRFGVPR